MRRPRAEQSFRARSVSVIRRGASAIRDRYVVCPTCGRVRRFSLASQCCLSPWSRYMFDEPSSYLDVKQRLKAAEVIRQLLTRDNYVVAVEHDLSVLDYLSDFVCCLYGKPSMYGVVTMPYSVREGQQSASLAIHR